jgi:hypothetical protein
MKVVVTQKNNIGRVTFSRIAKIGSLTLDQIGDVSTAGQQNGDVLVYNSETSFYQIKTLPSIDGGEF